MAQAGQRRFNAIVAYPGVMPAAIEVAVAFAERGLLARYETALAFRPERPLDRALRFAARRVLGARADQELGRRSLAALAGATVRRSPFWDGARVAALRLGAGDVVADRLWERMVLAFDRGVAGRLESGVGLVYGFEHGCRATFERARELGVAAVFDMAAPHVSFSQRVVERELQRAPGLRTAYRAATQARSHARDERKQAELDLATLVVANSSFTARSLIDTGFPPSRVRVVPLGAPPVDRSWRAITPGEPITFLFAGSVSVHKGAHVLFEAWRKLDPRAGAELVLAGGWALPDSLRQALPAGVRVLGSVPQNELFERYTRASALVFPTLCDGFGMVVTEALAHGLPVITTDRAGAADLLEPGRNGWVLPAGDSDALAERMQWCIDHVRELHAMREAAEAAAMRRPWSAYRAELVDTVCSCLSAA